MAKFLTTAAIGASIEKIIREAQCELVIITPYVQLSKNVVHRLQDASLRNVPIKVVFGKSKPHYDEVSKIEGFKNLSMFYLKHLHAKCYYNEQHMVLTSMNLYEFSVINNSEMGVFIDKKTDSGLYLDAVAEAESMVRNAALFGTNLKAKKLTKTANFTFQGYCIRCQDEIKYSPNKPLCDDCYTTWATYMNEQFEEKFCHSCGKNGVTTYGQPECRSCYRKRSAA